MLVCHADRSVARNFVAIKMVGVSAPFDRAAIELVRPGGLVVYCTCSLEPEEGERQVERILAGNPNIIRYQITAEVPGIDPAWITEQGDLRTLPFHNPGTTPEHGGMDGFFAARLRRLS